MTQPLVLPQKNATGIGYGQHPVDTKDYGYRSNGIDINLRYLMNQGTSGESSRQTRIFYNGFDFPPICKVRTTFVPEYDQTGRHQKYITIAISIEAIITPYQEEADSGITDNMDTDGVMLDIRRRLAQPGQELFISGHGMGVLHIFNKGEGSISAPKIIEEVGVTQPDIDYGPKPQVIEWEPVGGNRACRVEWLVTVRVPACGDLGTNTNQIIQMNNQVDWAVGVDGFIRRTVTGTFEVPSTINSGELLAGPGTLDVPYRTGSWLRARDNIERMFPTLDGFSRQYNFTLLADRKTTRYRIEDTEYRNPSNPLPPGMIKLDMTQKVSSALSKGAFIAWDMTISGTVEVPKNTSDSIPNAKKIAWVYIGLMMADRLNRTSSVEDADLSELDKAIGDLDDRLAGYQSLGYINTRQEISDNVFDNSFSFKFDWTLYSTTSLMYQVSGIFDEMALDGVTWTGWNNWMTENNVYHDNIYENSIPLHPDKEKVVFLCQPDNPDQETPINKITAGTKVDGTSIGSSKDPDKKRSYIKAETKSRLYETSPGIQGKVLRDGVIRTVELSPAENPTTSLTKEEYDAVSSEGDNFYDPAIKAGTSSSDDAAYYSSNFQNASNTITMVVTGTIIREKYPVNPPIVVGLDGKELVRRDRQIEVETISVGIPSDTNSNRRKIFHKMDYMLSYDVTGIPTRNYPSTTAIPDVYT